MLLRAGARPEVVNGISVSGTSALVPVLSSTLTWTASRPPRAWVSSLRPFELSLKWRIPAPLVATRSTPVLAITLRPANTVVVTWQVVAM